MIAAHDLVLPGFGRTALLSAREEQVPDNDQLAAAVAELVKRLDAAFGVYLDATSGFKALRERLMAAAAIAPSDNKKTFLYGKGDPNKSDNVIWHDAAVEEIIARTAVGAVNDRLLSQYLIVTVFHLWENEYRARIAGALGVQANDLKISAFGDFRLLRNEILKHRGLLTEGTAKKLEVLDKLNAGDSIGLSGDDIYAVLHTIKTELDRMVRDATGVDPLHRTIWHVE